MHRPLIGTVMENKVRVKRKTYVDYSLLFAVFFLIVFGAVMIYSASSYIATVRYSDPMMFAKKQLIFAGLGLVAMLVVAYIDYHWYLKLAWLAYITSLLLMLAVYFIGVEENGQTRWLVIGGINFQPAELVKISLILLTAHWISRPGKSVHKWKEVLLLWAIASPGILLVGKNNLSSGIIIGLIVFVTGFVASKHKILYALGAVLMAGAYFGAPLLRHFYIDDYRVRRIYVWLEPYKYATEGGYQVLQALYAVGSGGVFGKGLGQGLQKFSLPEAQNDMIFSIICEEMGLFGATVVIFVFMFILFRLFDIAGSAKDLAGSLLVIGVLVHIAVQLIFNVAVATNSMPNTGISLPFISYGGTALLFLMVEMGIVLSVAKGIRQE